MKTEVSAKCLWPSLSSKILKFFNITLECMHKIHDIIWKCEFDERPNYDKIEHYFRK